MNTQPNRESGKEVQDRSQKLAGKSEQEKREQQKRHEADNNPTTAKLRQNYDRNAPGMHPANMPADRQEGAPTVSKGTRMDLEDVTGNPGHRGVNPDAPGDSINRGPNAPPTEQERASVARSNLPVGSINEPPNVEPPPRSETMGSINEPAGSDVRRGIDGDGENTKLAQRMEQGGSGKGASGRSTGTTPAAGQGSQASINEPAGSTIGSNMPSEAPPVLSSIEPESVTIGATQAETFTLTATGSGFTEDCVIVFNDEDLDTTFVSETQLTAEAPTQTAAGEIDVEVANGEELSESITLSFEEQAPAGRQTQKKAPQRKPSKGKRDKSKVKPKSKR